MEFFYVGPLSSSMLLWRPHLHKLKLNIISAPYLENTKCIELSLLMMFYSHKVKKYYKTFPIVLTTYMSIVAFMSAYTNSSIMALRC